MSSLVQRGKLLLSQHRGELLFAVATMSAPVASLVAGVVGARVLQPEEMGTLNTVALLPAYLGVLHLGVFTGLARNLPLELGAGNIQHAERLARASAAFATVVASLGAAIALLWAGLHAFTNGFDVMAIALGVTAVTLFAAGVTAHTDTELRGRQRFQELSWALIGTNTITAISTGLVAAFGVLGGVARILACAIGSLLLRLPFRLWSPTTRLDPAATIELGRVGLPLLLSGAFFAFLMAADRSVIAVMMTKKDVGDFALASLLVNSLQFIPQSISMILFPKMAKEFGRSRSAKGLRRYLLLNLAFNVLTIIPVSLALYFWVEPLVHRYFPAYTTGIPAAKIACLCSMAWIYMGVGSIIGVVNKMMPYLAAMVVTLLLIWALGCTFVSHGYGIEGAAWARLIGTTFLCLFTIGYSWYLTTLDAHPTKGS